MSRLFPFCFRACALILATSAAAADLPGPPAPKPLAAPAGPRPDPRPSPGSGFPQFAAPSVQNPRLAVNLKAVWSEFGYYIPDFTSSLRAHWKQQVVPKGPNDSRRRSISVTFTMKADGTIDQAVVDPVAAGTVEEKQWCQQVLLAGSPYRPWTEAMIQKLGKSQSLTVVFYF